MKEVILEKNCDDTVEISFMEVYNEEVYDLLSSQANKLLIQGML